MKDNETELPRSPTTPPGDYREKNALQIATWANNYSAVESLWLSEAEEARRSGMVEREAECRKLAALTRQFHQAIIAFYSRWQLRP
jgi:hypothetical protein